MKTRLLRGFSALAATVGLVLALAAPASAQARPRVLAVHFDMDVNPVSQGYLTHQLDRAVDERYDAVVILLDTPGGLLESMRKIYQAELASPIPVIVYVSPDGARAASAGVWIGQAADVLAMAPQTNIGSATPISGTGQNIDSDLKRKIVNDAVASLTALAKRHGRNAEWPAQAVRQASNLTADRALELHVIDAVAPSLPALLNQLEGRKTVPKGFELHLSGARIDEAHPSFLNKFLDILVDPNLVALLFLAGIAGIGYEIFHPGVVLPGALGAVALVLSLFGAFILPITWGGVALVLLGIGLLVLDVFVTSHGALTVAGLISLAIGAVMTFNNAPEPYEVSKPLVIAVAVGLGLLWAFAIGKAVQVRRRPVTVGAHTLVGALGEVRRDGLVFLNGELWQARAASGAQLRPGERVRVERLDGLTLEVTPVATA
ncbi:MAG: nodulation protein NfeD [Actinomycetota bacterium]|nr:nodulation protein NfeD [Actinomycetota bacterium]